jgi:hypothetical protein
MMKVHVHDVEADEVQAVGLYHYTPAEMHGGKLVVKLYFKLLFWLTV